MVKNNKNTTNVGGLNRVPPYSFSDSGFNYDPLAEQLGSENIQIEGKRALKQTLNKRGITTELDSAVRNNIPYEEAKSSLSTEQNKGGAKQIDEKTHQVESTDIAEDNNPFAIESPYLPLQTKFDKALYGKEKDSPFVTNLKQQAVESDLYFSTDRTDLQYKQDKSKYEQEAKDRAQYGRMATFKTPTTKPGVGNMSASLDEERSKNYGVYQWLKDSWNSFQNGIDRTNLDSNRGQLVNDILPNLKAAEVQLNYVNALKSWDDRILQAKSKVNANPTRENINIVNTLEQAKERDLYDIRSKDKETEQYIQNLYASGWLNDLNKAQSQLTKDYAKRQTELNDKLAENNEIQKSLNDNEPISAYYKKKAEDAQFSYTNLDSWLYKMPETLGSSAETWKAQVATLGSQAALYQVGRIAAQAATNTVLAAETGGASLVYQLATIGSALASTGVSLYSNYYQRQRETQAEVYQNYKERVSKDAADKGVDLEKIKQNAKETIASNLPATKDGKPHEVTDEEAYDFLLTSNLSSGDKKFDDLKFNAKKGLETLINTNMALSASDFAEELIFNPFLGAVTKKAFKAARTLKNIDKAVIRAEAIRNIGKEIPFTIAKKITETATAKQALKGVENFVDLTLTKLPGVSKVIDKAVKPVVSAVTSLNGKTYSKYVTGVAKKGLQGMFLEGGEEGTQAEKGYEYQHGLYDKKAKGLLETMESVVGGMFNGGRAAFGLSVNPTLDNNDDYQQNVIAGAMMGGLFGGGIGGVKESINLVKQIKANNYVQNITADDMLSKENMLKARLWADKKIKGKEDNVIEALTMLKDRVPEGLTSEDIDKEIERAKYTMQYADSKLAKQIAKTAGVAYGSDEYKTMVGLAIDSKDQLDSEKDTNRRLSAAIDAMGSIGKDVLEDKLTNISKATGLPTDILHTLNQFNTRQTALVELINDLKTRKDVIEKMNNDKQYSASLNSEHIDEYINRLEGELENISNNRSNFINDIAKQVGPTTGTKTLTEITVKTPEETIVTEKGGKKTVTPLHATYKEEVIPGYTAEDVNEMLSNISDQTGATGSEINNLHKLQYLSNLSLEDAYNRYNAYHGLFFTDRDATRATTLKKATKGMSEVEKRDFAAAMLAKDEINHYTHSSLKDRQLLTEYLTKQNQDRNLGITPEETEEITPAVTTVEPIVTHFDNEYDATIDKTNKVKSELDKQIQDTQATINILKNNPANTVKFLPKELKKEVAKLGYTKVLTKYQSQLDDLTNQNQLADITIQKAEVNKKLATATEEKRVAVKQAIDDVTGIYAKIKQELPSQIITDENGKQRKVVTATEEEVTNIFGKYQDELESAKARYQKAVSDLDNPEVTPAKRTAVPVREKAVEIKEEEKSNEQPAVIPANPVKPTETELLAQDLTAEDYGYDENADWQLTSGVLDVNDTEQASVADNQVVYGGELGQPISSKEETIEPLKTSENASQGPSTVSKAEEPKELPKEFVNEPESEHTSPEPTEKETPKVAPVEEEQPEITALEDTSLPTYEEDNEVKLIAPEETSASLIEQGELTTDQLNEAIRDNKIVEGSITGLIPTEYSDVKLMYNPTSTVPMKIEGFSKLKSGKELYDRFEKSESLDEFTTEVVVRDYKGDKAIYVIFTDKEGNQYATALRTNEDARRVMGVTSQEDFDRLDVYKQRSLERLADLRSKIIKISESEEYKNNPNAIIRPTKVTRNSGYFNNVKDSKGVPVFRPIHQVKGFGLWHEDGTPFDFSEITAGENGSVIIGIGRGARFGNTIMNDQGDIMSGLGASGKLYIYPPLRFIPDGKSRNIQLMEKPFKFSTPEVARQVGELLYNVMIKQYNNDSFAYQIEHNGRMVDTPFTPAMLSKFMVNNGQKTILSKEDAEAFPFLVSKQLFVDTKNGQVYYGNSKHSLAEMQTNPNLKEDFIKHIIENQHWAMDKDWLYKNMRETVLTSAINYFNTTGAEKLSIIPGELEFDKDDFGLIQGEYDLREDPNNKGLSWMGWYAKNGKLLSDLDDKLFKSPMHYIEDVTLDNKQTGTDPSNNPHVTVEEENPLLAALKRGALKIETDEEFNFSSTPEINDDYVNPDDLSMFGFGEAFKLATKPVKRRINTDRAIKYLNEKLGLTNEQIHISDTLLNVSRSGTQAWGGMMKDSIILYKGAERGTEYHEAFHRVSLLLLSPRERAKLYKEYRSNYNAKDLSDVAVEENLADEFMDFNLNPLLRLGYEINKAFRKILEFLHIIDKYEPNYMYELFKDINKGTYKNVKTNPESVLRFTRLYGDMAPFEINGKAFKYIPTTTDYYNIVSSLQSLLFSINKVYTVNDIGKINTSVLKGYLKAQSENLSIPEARRNVIKEVLERFDSDFLPDIKGILKDFSIRDIDKKAEDDAAAIDAGSKGIDFDGKASYEIDKAENASMATKIFVATLPKGEFVVTTKDGVETKKLVYPAESLTGLPIANNYKQSFNLILDRLHNCDTWDKVLAKTADLAKNSPFFAVLNSKFNNPKVVDENLKTQLLMTINSNKHNMNYIQYGYELAPDGKTRQVTFRVGDSNIQKTSRVYTSLWSNNFYNSNLISNVGEKPLPNKPALKQIADDYAVLVKEYSDKYKTNTVTQSSVRDTKKGLLNILGRIGVNIDLETLDDYLAANRSNNVINEAKELNHLLTSVYAGSMSYLFSWKKQGENVPMGLLQMVHNGAELKYKVSGRETTKRLNEIFKGEGTISKLADAQSRVHPIMDSLSVLGSDNNLLYPISQNCYATDQVRWLNDNTDNIVTKLSTVPYNAHSIVLSQLRNGGKISLGTFINFVEEGVGDRGRDYLSLSDVEDFMSKMTFIQNDRLVFPTMADKKMYFTISGVKLNHGDLRFERNKNGGISVNFNDGVVATMRGYLYDELATIDKYWSKESQELLKNNPNRKVKNYHTNNNGGMFRYFNMLFENGAYTDLNDILKDESLPIEERIAEVKNKLLGKEVGGKRDGAYVNRVINNMLSVRYLDDLETAVKLGIIEREGTNKYKNKLLDQVKLQEKIELYKNDPIASIDPESYAVRSMIADFSTGTVISVQEFERLFTKDPAYYKSTDDKIKRVTAILSTGDSIQAEGTFNVTEFKDNEIASNQYDQLLEKFTKAGIRSRLIESVSDINEDNVNEYMNLSDKELSELVPDYKTLKATAEAIARRDLKSYDKGNVNQTDATVIIGPEMYKKIVKGLGEWSDDIAKAYEIMEGDGDFLSDPILYKESTMALIKPLKTMFFGDNFDAELGLDVPVFDKMAMFPLFKVLAKGDSKALYDRMNDVNSPIDMVTFSSAVKVGTRASSKFYTDESNTAINDLSKVPVYKQDFKYLRRQLVTDPHHAERQLFGTQVAKAAASNLRFDHLYGKSPKEGEKDTRRYGVDIKNEIINSMNALSTKGLNRFYNEVSTVNEDGTRSTDNRLISKMLIREGESAGIDREVLDGMRLENDDFIVPLSALSDASWVESRFITSLNKEAVDIKLPGGAFIQKSSFAQKKIEVLSDSSLNRGKYLNFINEDGSMDCEISINLLMHIVPEEYRDTHEHARQYLIDNNIIGENASPIALGYRIPTQGQSSIVSLRVKDVMPTIVGDMIILPDEFTALTGSDFDIDKLYVARYNFEEYEEDGVKKTRKIEFDDNLGDENTTKWEANSREANENRLLDMYMLVLNDDAFVNETKVSLDAATNLLKEGALKEVDKANKKTNETPFYKLSPSYQLSKKHEYTGGKAGIAPFALNNVHHVLTQLFGLEYARNKKGHFKGALTKYNFGNLHGIYGQDGMRILDWISAMINAHVDVAKDPYIIRLNVTQPTYNMTNFLLRSGLGETTFYFLPQPILKEYAAEMDKLNGRYGVDKTKSNFLLQQDAIDKIIKDYTEKATYYAGEDLDKKGKLDNLTTINENTGLSMAGGDFVFDRTFLKEQLNKFGKGETENFDYYYNQLLILNAYRELTPFADELSELVHISQIDTKKFGNSFALQNRFLYRVKNMLANSSAFNTTDLRRFFKESFLDTKLRNSVIAGHNLLKNMLVTSTDQFNETVEFMLSQLNASATKDETLIKNISNSINAFVKSKFFSEYIGNELSKENLLKNPDRIAIDTYNLFYDATTNITDNLGNIVHTVETKSMANRLAKIKADILNGVYPEYADKEGRITNELLTYLSPIGKTDSDVWNVPDIIGRNAAIGTDKFFQTKLKRYWEELINSTHPEISQFAKDLVVYAFVTSGDNTKLNSIFHLVPESYKTAIGYNESIRTALSDLINNNFNIDVTDIFKNNWHNGNMVPDLTLDKGKSHIKRISSNANVTIPGTVFTYPMVLFNHKAYPIGENKHGDTLFKPYIKVNLDRSKNPLTTLLYEHIGNYRYKDATGQELEKPVYKLINKKGINQDGVFVLEHDGYDGSGFAFNNIDPRVDHKIVVATRADDEATLTNRLSNDTIDRIIASSNLTNERSIKNAIAELKEVTVISDHVVADAAALSSYEDIMDGRVKTGNDLFSSINETYNNKQTIRETTESITETTKLLNNTEDTNNDPTNFNDENTSIEILNSDNGILTNDEVKLLRKASTKEQMTSEFNKGFKSNFKIAVASEHTDPVFFANQLIAMLDGKRDIKVKYGNAPKASDIKALYIITKHDGLPIKSLIEYDIPKIIHFSITTLGGTKYEPGVMKADDLLDRIETFIGQGLDPSGITLRIDPIIPFVTKMENVEHIVERASKMGIKKVRFSVMDYYSTTAKFMQDLGYDYNKAYNKDATGKYYMHAKREILDMIMTKMAALKDKYGVTLSTCAEPIVTKDVSKEACLSVNAVNQLLGTSISDEMIGKQRKLCSCFGGKTDLLQYDNTCLSTCAYCYAHHNDTKPFDYYDSEGKLKNNIFTKTSKEVEQKITKPKDLPTIEPFNDIDKPLIKNETDIYFDVTKAQNTPLKIIDINGDKVTYVEMEWYALENSNLNDQREVKDSRKTISEKEFRSLTGQDYDSFTYSNDYGFADVHYTGYKTVDGNPVYSAEIAIPDESNRNKGIGSKMYEDIIDRLASFNAYLTPGMVVDDNHKWESLANNNRIKTVTLKNGSTINVAIPKSIINDIIPTTPVTETQVTLPEPYITETGVEYTTTDSPNIVNINGREIDAARYGIPFKLNSDQTTAVNRIMNWFNNSEPGSFHTLIGAAGTGKSSITKLITKLIGETGAPIAIGAYTHTAKNIISAMTGKEANTIHSLLGFALNFDLDNFNTDNLNFVKSNASPLYEKLSEGNGILIIDECSMINEALTTALTDLAKSVGAKVLFIGDAKQLKPVNETEISLTFRGKPENRSELTIVERQTNGNPLLNQLDAARLSIDNPYQRSISFTTDFNQFGQGIVTVPYDKVHAPKLIDLAVELIISDAGKTDPYIIRALTGTNKQRVNIGNAIRYKLGYSKNFVVGEPIRFYTGTEKFVNSQEAVVLDSSDEYTLDLTKELGFTGSFKNGLGVKANDVIIGDISDNEIKEKFALITDDYNSNDIAKLLSEYKQMVLDAVKNRPNDRGKIWRDYYKNIGKITTSFDIKLGNATVKSATLSTAYAATIHKSQGSTYTNVIVDMMDVNNNFNNDPQLRKQLAYVAMSRPTNAAFVITNDEVSTRPDAISEYKEAIDKYNKEYSDEARNNCKNS